MVSDYSANCRKRCLNPNLENDELASARLRKRVGHIAEWHLVVAKAFDHIEFGPHFFCTQVEAKKVDDERLASARTDARLADLSLARYESVTSSGQGMRFDDATIRASGAIDVASSWMDKTCLTELADATNLMDCTVGELRRVLATLYVYSLFVTKLEDASDDQPALDVTLKSCVVARRQDALAAGTHTITFAHGGNTGFQPSSASVNVVIQGASAAKAAQLGRLLLGANSQGISLGYPSCNLDGPNEAGGRGRYHPGIDYPVPVGTPV